MRRDGSAGAPLRIALAEFGSRGGLLHYSAQMADALARRGHEVTLVVPRGHELEVALEAATVAPVLASFDMARPRAMGRIARLVQRAARAAAFARAWRDLDRYAVRERPQILQLGDLRYALDAVAVQAISRRRSRPLLVDVCHNVVPLQTGAADQLFRRDRVSDRTLRGAYRRLDLVLVHGEESRRQFAAHWGVPTPVEIIPHGDEGIFGDPLEPTAGVPTVLFFGTWSRYKGLGLLLDAFSAVTRHLPEARLEIVGYPTRDAAEAEIRAAAAHLGPAVRIDPRYVSLEEAREAFRRATVVALPYRAGFRSGVASIAFTLARPVVATRVGDTPADIEAAGAGLVVPPDEPAAFAAALERLLRNPAEAAEMGRRGRRWTESEASWEVVAERLETAYGRHLRGDSVRPA